MRLVTIGTSILITTASLFASVSAANAADVIFDDIGSGYNPNAGYAIAGADSYGGQGYSYNLGAPFTATHNDVISEINLGMTNNLGSGIVYVQLIDDVNGQFGTILGGTQLGPILNGDTYPVSSTETYDWNNVGIPVVAGDSYYVFVSTGDDGSNIWNWNAEGVTLSGDPTFIMPAFTVLGAGTAVPEPSAWALSMLGLTLLGAALRQRRQLSNVV